MTTIEAGLSSAGFSIEEQMNCAAHALGLPLLVLDAVGTPIAATPDFPSDVLALLQRNRQVLLQQGSASFPTLTLYSLAQANTAYGWLVLPTTSEHLSVQQEDQLAQFGSNITFLLWHKQEIDDHDRRYREHFLYDLIYHNFESSNERTALGRLWNYHVDRPHYVMVAEFDLTRSAEQLSSHLALLEQEALRFFSRHVPQPISLLLDDQLVLLLEQSNLCRQGLCSMAKQFQQELHARAAFLPTLSIGIGQLHDAPADLCRSFQEAKQAVSLGRYRHPTEGITSYADLGILKLLSHVRTEELDDFCQETLAPLIDYDEKNNTAYLRTLEVYFEENESLPAAAQRLFIHVNTLRNHIRKISELLDADLTFADQRVLFYVACQSLRVLRHLRQ